MQIQILIFGINKNGAYEIYTASTIYYSQNSYDTVIYSGRIQNSKINAVLTVNDAQAVTTQRNSATFVDANLCLFKLGNYESPFYNKVKMKYTKIWFDDILVRDFIPVLDQDNVPCLYDKISNKFFYNAGTGNFLYE